MPRPNNPHHNNDIFIERRWQYWLHDARIAAMEHDLPLRHYQSIHRAAIELCVQRNVRQNRIVQYNFDDPRLDATGRQIKIDEHLKNRALHSGKRKDRQRR